MKRWQIHTFGLLEFKLAEPGIELGPFHTSSFEDVTVTYVTQSAHTRTSNKHALTLLVHKTPSMLVGDSPILTCSIGILRRSLAGS